MAETLDIVAFSGSLRKGSYNTMLVKTVASMAPVSMKVELLTLKGIPLYDGDDEAALGIPQIVQDMQDRIRRADGVMISTPEYNFSIPGVL